MEKMQEFVDYIFTHVWCEALAHDYELRLFNGNSTLKDIITNFHYTEPIGAEFFIKGIQEIFDLFKSLKPSEIDNLKIWFQSNNSIEELCKNNTAIIPTTYEDIDEINAKLSASLKAFFMNLYSQNFLTLKPLSDKISTIDDHYKEFVKANSIGKCPFCGLYPIDGEYVQTREAYDHYLPKSKYPFSSINLKNLAPICNKCNSGNKSTKDPLRDQRGNRRKAFYPYEMNKYNIEIKMEVSATNIEHLKPENLSIEFGPQNLNEELSTWNQLFNIEDRYKAECCSAEGKDWITQIHDCSYMPPIEYLHIVLEHAQKCPYSDNNFLRKPYLEACEAQQVFK